MLFYAFQERPHAVIGIVQETDKHFKLAVARASPQARKSSVNHIRASHNRFNSVGKCQLEVVMGVYADFYSKLPRNPHVFCHQVADLLAVQRSETVNQINSACTACS